MTADKDILKLIPTLQATALAKKNLKFTKKKKKQTKDFLEMGTGNIVGISLIDATADFIDY